MKKILTTTGKIIMLGIVALAVLAISVLILVLAHHGDTGMVEHNSQGQPCESAAKPCIELQTAAGKDTGIKFNDFRFGPQGCIYWRMTTNDAFKEYCGGYNLKWIGPGLPPGREGTI